MTTWRALAALTTAMILCGCSKSVLAPVASGPAAEPTQTAARTVTIPGSFQAENGIAVAPVRARTIPETARSTARITIDENSTWRVGSVVEGRVIQVLVNPGDMVRKGQVLARIHSHDIHESRALYKRAKADLARLEGLAEYALRQRDRAKRLYELKAGSLAQLEQKETELRNAETDVRNAGFELERTRTHLEEVLGIPAEESDIPASTDGGDNDLIPVPAPANGIVLTRNITPGTVVNPASDLFVISDLASLWAIAEMNEEYLGRLRPGMAVRISVQAYPGEIFRGRIGRLGESLNAQTRTIQVRVDLANSRGRLKPEMYATAEIELGAGGQVLAVPAEAVQDVRGQTVVFVQTAEDTFEARSVQTGRTLDGAYEITSGLRDGERVAVRAAFVLKSEFLKSTLAN